MAGLLAWVFWPSPSAIQVATVKIKPAEIADESGAEMSMVTLSISNRLRSVTLLLARDSARIEVNIAGTWVKVPGPFLPSQVRPKESKEELLIIPGGADRCRIRLQYTFVSLAWRLGGSLSRLGIKLPPRYWQWAGWPTGLAENPSWKEFRIELPLVPHGAPSRHSAAMNRLSATHANGNPGFVGAPVIGYLACSSSTQCP